MDVDRDILFGVLALESGLIDSAQLHEARDSWQDGRGRPLADWIVARGWISPGERATLEARIDRDLEWASCQSATITPPPVAPTAIPGGNAAHRNHRPPEHETRLQTAPEPDFGTLEVGSAETRPWAQAAVAKARDDRPRATPRYQLEGLHGQGGIGRIWVARDDQIGREVALKELRPDRAGNHDLAVRFLAEARITGQLEHPGIVPVYELSEGDGSGRPFYTMRLIRGRTLNEAIHDYHVARRRDPRSAASALKLHGLLNAFIAAGNAIAYAHSRGVIHRDLKPQNVILGDFGEVMVLDWGLAKVEDGPIEADSSVIDLGAESDHRATLPGHAIGTPSYMSPEQANGRLGAIGPRSDVYGLGAILYQILTDRAPFEGPTPEVIRRVLHEEPTRPGSLRPETPKALEAICLKALAKAPDERYDDARALTADVQRWLADEPVTACAETWTARLRRLTRRHRGAVIGLAALLVAALVALVIGYLLVDRQKRRAEQARDLAEHNSIVARQTIHQMVKRFGDDRLANIPQLQSLRTELAILARSNDQMLLSRDPNNPQLQRAAADTDRRSANILRWAGRPAEAEPIYAEAIRFLEGLIRRTPGEFSLRADLASVLIDAAANQERLGRPADAESQYLRAIELTTMLCEAYPGAPAYLRWHALGLNNLADLRSKAGKPDEALRLIDQAVAIQESLARRRLPGGIDRLLLVGSLVLQGTLLDRLGHADEAGTATRRAVDLARLLAAEQPGEVNIRFFLAKAQLARGQHHARDPGHAAEARTSLLEAARLLERLLGDYPTIALYRQNLATTRAELARLPGPADATPR